MNSTQRTVKNKLSLALLFTTLCFTSINANAHDAENHQHGHKHQYENSTHERHQGNITHRVKHLAHYLDLTKQQRQQLKALVRQQKDDKQGHRDNMAKFKDNLDISLSDTVFDEAVFSDIYNQYQNDFMMIAMNKAKMRHAIYQLLTPAQQQKFLHMKKQRPLLQ